MSDTGGPQDRPQPPRPPQDAAPPPTAPVAGVAPAPPPPTDAPLAGYAGAPAPPPPPHAAPTGAATGSPYGAPPHAAAGPAAGSPYGGAPAWGPTGAAPAAAPPYGGAPGWGPPGPAPAYNPYGARGHGLPECTAGKRFAAYLLDAVLVMVTLVIGWLIWSLIVWGQGQTPAKQLLHMRCIDTHTGRAAGWGAMALRELVGKALLGNVTCGISTIVGGVMILDDSPPRQSLWDKLANTVVVEDPHDRLAP